MNEKEYCVCVCVCRQKIGNFKTEPPGLFRGRGDHPKQGRIKVGTPSHPATQLPGSVPDTQ